MGETIGQAIRRLRERAGVSQTKLARLIVVDQSTLSRYETDKLPIDKDAAKRIDKALGTGEELQAVLNTPNGTPRRVDRDTLDAITELVYEGAHDLPATIAARTAHFRRLDDYIGGRELYPTVKRDLAAAGRATRHDTAALPALADLGQVAGWVASDAGLTEAATRHYLTAARAGQDAGRPDLAAAALSTMSYQLANSTEPTDRAEAALLSASVVDRVSGVGRALLLERVAWAHARLGDANEAMRALDRVDREFTDAKDPAPTWAYWLDPDEISVMRGRCMVELGMPTAAIDLLSDALKRYDPSHVREWALYTTYLAEALAAAGEANEARRLLGALGDASSARVEARLRALSPA